jgi:type VI protein secretion system component Hcp
MLRKIVSRDTLAIFTALCCLVLFMPTPAHAQGGTTFQYYLQIPGIHGESVAAKDAIDLLALTFGDSNAILLSSTSGGWKPGPVKFSDLTFTAVSSKASPFLFYSVAAGTKYSTVTLTGKGDMSDGRKITVVYTLSPDVFITGYQFANNNGGVPTETVSLTFGAISYEYTAVNPATNDGYRCITYYNMESFSGAGSCGPPLP